MATDARKTAAYRDPLLLLCRTLFAVGCMAIYSDRFLTSALALFTLAHTGRCRPRTGGS